MKKYIYGAYGSNLNHDQMARRCPKARFLGTGLLKDHQLVFRGVEDMEYRQGSNMAIGLWEITEDCLESLDKYEGFPYLYERTILNVVKPNRKIVRAIVYYMLRDNYEPPSESYLLSIKEGYEHCGIPVDRLINAVEQMGEVYYG